MDAIEKAGTSRGGFEDRGALITIAE